MNKKSLWIIGALVATAVAGGRAGAQIVPNGLPAGYAVPSMWTAAGPLSPQPPRDTAQVFWAYELKAGVYTYWYRVDHLGPGPSSGNPAIIDNIASAALGVDPSLIVQKNGVYQFGQNDTAQNRPGQSWAAELVNAQDTSIGWGWQGNAAYNQVQPYETELLWLQSPYGPTSVTFSLDVPEPCQCGRAYTTIVKGPGTPPVPEPASMALAAVGLTVVGYVRRRRLS